MARLAIAVLLLGACRPAPTVAPSPTLANDDGKRPAPALPSAEEAVRALEQKLLTAKGVSVLFEVESHGEVETKLRGILVLADGGRALLEVNGTFAGQAGTARIECDGKMLRGSSGTARLEMPCPNALGPALVLGLVRMGVLHNVARAWSAKPPDRAQSDDQSSGPTGEADPAAAMNAWVTTTGHQRPSRDGTAESASAVAFAIVIDGQPVGDATLALDAAGLPTSREQTVRFPGGEMRVVERYESFELAPPERP